MKSFLPDFKIQAANSLEEALALIDSDTKLKPFAGGTDIMVLFEVGKLKSHNFLSLHKINDLKGIYENAEYIDIGALTTFSEISESKIINEEFPLIVHAARATGALAIQNRGTIGGNIVNASPAADTPPALLVYDTKILLSSKTGERWVDYDQFHKDYKKIDLEPNEILSKIRINKTTRPTHSSYVKVGTRKAQAISKVCFAAKMTKLQNKIEKFRLAYGSVAPTPIRCLKVEKHLENKILNDDLIESACVILQNEIKPISDIRSTEGYRRKVSENLLRDFLKQR